MFSEVEHEAINHNLDLAAGVQEKENSMETVRDIVEKIVEGLVGNVDNTPVNRIYDHPACKFHKMFCKIQFQNKEHKFKLVN